MANPSSASTNMAAVEDGYSRSSAGSSRSSTSRSKTQNPQQQLSTIEKSVTHLLVATKQLLETLTTWSRGNATETEVSDVYVRLGYEFNIACRAFNAIGVETTDLGPVPDLLRTILEDTLSQEATQASLDKYLPRIRDIIINLLHGLKKKQQRLRARPGAAPKDGPAEPRPPRHASSTITGSIESGLSQPIDEVPARTSSSRSYTERRDSREYNGHDLPPRTTSTGSRTSPRRRAGPPDRTTMLAELDGNPTGTGVEPSPPFDNMPVMTPYPEKDTIPTIETTYASRHILPEEMPPLPPTPEYTPSDALSALQRGGELERRASRRFSAYQIQKHLGGTMNGLGALPPSQNSPVPNRGRETRESLTAVRSRTNGAHTRVRSRNERVKTDAPTNGISEVQKTFNELNGNAPTQNVPELKEPPVPEELDSPTTKTPEDKIGGYEFIDFDTRSSELPADAPRSDENGPETLIHAPVAKTDTSASSLRRYSRQPPPPASVSTPPPPQFVPDGSPQAGRELTLFLQYKSKIKKFVLPDGGDLSTPRLQLAFIEKFAWNTHNNGVDLPEIYLQDPVSGVRHELEDLSDIKDRSVLVLNVEALDEVKRHIDDGIGGLKRIVEGLKSSVDDQHSAIQRISDRQQETAKEVALIAAAPPMRNSAIAVEPGLGRKISFKDRTGQLNEVQSLRRDLAVIRQTYTSFASDVEAQMTTIRTKAAAVKKVAAHAVVPEMDENTGRAYVNKGKKSLSEDSEKIVNRVDDLQDLVEDLRKDVVTRGVRPLPRQLESVSKDISTATTELKKMQEYLRKEKPIWTKIWEKELQIVCDDRDLLTMQEELATDLEDDLEKAAATFALVEEATKQQSLQTPSQVGLRSVSRTLAVDQGADPHKAKDSVLGEVRALQPNHESRLEAIERAERSRQRELKDRREDKFAKELGNFVEEGKLKKSGGVEEVERMRQQREEQARRDFAELQARRRQEQLEREMAAMEAAAAAAAQPPAVVEEPSTDVLNETDALEKTDGQQRHSQDRESSPEADFVEAKEDISTPGENGPRLA